MSIRSDQSGFSHTLIILLSAVVIVIVATAFTRVWTYRSGTSISGYSSQTGLKCIKEHGLQLCLKAPGNNLSYIENMKLTVTLKNQGGKTYTWQGSSSCGNQAILDINKTNHGIMGPCTADITTFRLGPGRTETQTLVLSGSDLQTGKNIVQAIWIGISTPALMVTGHSASTSEKTKTTANCLSGHGHPYCSTVFITVRDGYYSETSTCDDLAKYFVSLKIKPEESSCSGAAIGLIDVLVPKGSEKDWQSKLLALPQIESANYYQN